MDPNKIPDFDQYRKAWAQDLELLFQNRLLNESALIAFARDRGLPVWGVITGDPGELHKRGWLRSDGTGYKAEPLFHPFRIYTLYKVLEVCELHIVPSSTLRREKVLGFVERILPLLPSVDKIGENAQEWNRIVDFAILLEPAHWPRITGRLSRPIGVSENDYEAVLNEYRQKVLHLVETLDANLWREIHEMLRIDSAEMDENGNLYLLLRLATWNRRETLKGRVSGALWIRHIAEVIRRAFEEVYDESWPEEDQAFGTWFPSARQRVFGSERPLDDELRSKPYLAWEYGLFTGSAVRWYVEGQTEYYAIDHVLGDPAKVGIELVNLRGTIRAEQDNVALKLQDWLLEDMRLRRFSVISFDFDVAATVKVIRHQVEEHNIVGFIAAHRPDFEFANFTISELAEVAARIDETNGFSGDAVRNANWTGIANGRAFETKYKAVSTRNPSGLKGEEWGRALAVYASEHPNRSDNGKERPFWTALRAALMGRIANYDLQKEHSGFDRETFEQFELKATRSDSPAS